VQTVTVISCKGGAGQTPITVNLAITAHLGGLKTVLVDCDQQRSASISLASRQVEGPHCVAVGAGAFYQQGLVAVQDLYDFRVIDTPWAPKTDIAAASNCADLCLSACRPTFLDIAVGPRLSPVSQKISDG